MSTGRFTDACRPERSNDAFKHVNQRRRLEDLTHDEGVNRQRLDRLEATVSILRPYIFPEEIRPGNVRILTLFEQMEPLRRSFWGRLRWLFTGK